MPKYYALGRTDDPSWYIGSLVGTTFHWSPMPRATFERVISGRAEKHCGTCTCDAEPPADVIEDDQGARLGRMDFMMILASADSETRP